MMIIIMILTATRLKRIRKLNSEKVQQKQIKTTEETDSDARARHRVYSIQ